MKVSDFLINVKRPKAVLTSVRSIINKDEFKEALVNDDFVKLDALVLKYNLGHQELGLLWSIVRESNPDIDILELLDHVPCDYYAYCNISDPIDLSSYNNLKYIGAYAFYKSNLDHIYLPGSIEELRARCFNELDGGYIYIEFPKTVREWRHIKKDPTVFNDHLSKKYVSKDIQCSDGNIS